MAVDGAHASLIVENAIGKGGRMYGTISIAGVIACPDGASHPRREISIAKIDEYGKLPFSKFPPTCNTNINGIGVRLFHGQQVCDASLHRKNSGEFWIYNARKRLGNPKYTALYEQFIKKSGLAACRTPVRLEFNGNNIYI